MKFMGKKMKGCPGEKFKADGKKMKGKKEKNRNKNKGRTHSEGKVVSSSYTYSRNCESFARLGG